MRLTTRIAIALVLLMGVMTIVLAHQLRMVNDLQRINEELSRTDMQAARVSIRLVQGIEGVWEFSSKLLVTGEEGYVEGWATWEEAVQNDLARLRELDLGPVERQAIRDVELSWHRYLFEISPLREDRGERLRGEDLDAVMVRVDQLRDELLAGAEEVIEANHARVAAQARRSVAAGERAHRVAWISAIGVGAFALLVCALLYLSISGPLKRLTRGTREIAQGHFDHRIPADGRDELSHLARDFNLMATHLGELDEMKRDFVSHVSHELKGPLAAIHETILVMLERIPGPLNEKQAQLLALSRQSATRLSGMIANLLQVSMIEGGALALEPEWVDLQALLHDVRDELTPLATERDLEIKVCDFANGDAPDAAGDAPASHEHPERGTVDDGRLTASARNGARIAADPNRMREVVGNLLENAIKFSPQGTRITLAVQKVGSPPDSLPDRCVEALADRSPPFFMLTVEDEGPGIPKEHREGIFEKFYQVKRGARVKGQGVGLGLAICRNLVASHGGAIWVEEGDSGARFCIVLPQLAAEIQNHLDRLAPVRSPARGGATEAGGVRPKTAEPRPSTASGPGRPDAPRAESGSRWRGRPIDHEDTTARKGVGKIHET